MDLDQATSSDGSPGSTDHEGEGENVVQFEMDASVDHTEHQFNNSGLSASSGGSYAAHRSHESLAEDEALSREEGTKKRLIILHMQDSIYYFLTLFCMLKVYGSNTRRVTDLTVVQSSSSPHPRLELDGTLVNYEL